MAFKGIAFFLAICYTVLRSSPHSRFGRLPSAFSIRHVGYASSLLPFSQLPDILSTEESIDGATPSIMAEAPPSEASLRGGGCPV